MKFIRVEKEPNRMVRADGEAGTGIYFSSNSRMVDYYRDKTHVPYRIIEATPKQNCEIVDFTEKWRLEALIVFMREQIKERAKEWQFYIPPKINQKNYQRYGDMIQQFLRDKDIPHDAYLVNHQFDGSALPKGKQLVIVNEDAFVYRDIYNEFLEEGRRTRIRRLLTEASAPHLKVFKMSDSFDIWEEITNNRFIYNPATDHLIVGGNDPNYSSHSEEFYDSGEAGVFDDCVRGWIGVGRGYPSGIIHFAPPITKYFQENQEYADAVLRTIEFFAQHGATDTTAIRNFLKMGEQKFEDVWQVA